MQGCTLFQTDNHANTSPLRFLQAGCPSCHPTNSIKALKATVHSAQMRKILATALHCDTLPVSTSNTDIFTTIYKKTAICFSFAEPHPQNSLRGVDLFS